MEAKKGLNNTQRKILEEIYVDKLKSDLKAVKSKRQSERDAFIKSVIDEELKAASVKRVKKALDNLVTTLEKDGWYLEERGIKVNGLPGYRDDGDLSRRAAKIQLELHSSYGERDNPMIQDYDEETLMVQARYEAANREIRAKIWGLDTSYEEIEKEVQAVLNGIK